MNGPVRINLRERDSVNWFSLVRPVSTTCVSRWDHVIPSAYADGTDCAKPSSNPLPKGEGKSKSAMDFVNGAELLHLHLIHRPCLLAGLGAETKPWLDSRITSFNSRS